MVSLKRTPQEVKDREKEISQIEPERYPVGVWFHDDEVKKLGLENVEVGDEVAIVATLKVRSKSMHDSTSGGSSHSVSTDMIEAEVAPGVNMKEAADKIFGDGE